MVIGILMGNCNTQEFMGWIDKNYFERYTTSQSDSNDPGLIIKMACALYNLGDEMEGGDLKDLDLTTYYAITLSKHNLMLLVIIDPHSKKEKKIDILKESLVHLHSNCQEILKNEKCGRGMGDQIKEYFKDIFHNSKYFIQKIENLTFWTNNPDKHTPPSMSKSIP